MGRFKHINGMVAIVSRTGENSKGIAVRVEIATREQASTKGILFVRVFRGSVGVSCEQFSGSRRPLAQERFDAFVSLMAKPAPVVKARAAKEPTVETIWERGPVAVRWVRGSRPQYRIEVAGQERQSCPVTRNWKRERDAMIAEAQGLVA